MKITKSQFNNTDKNLKYIRKTIWRRSYSTSNPSNLDTPTPVLTISNLQDKDNMLSKRKLLINKGGIYSFTNKTHGKQYIGSANDLYLRLNEDLSKRKSSGGAVCFTVCYIKARFRKFQLLYLRIFYLWE